MDSPDRNHEECHDPYRQLPYPKTYHPLFQYSKYHKVEVLLLRWEDDDLEVSVEIEKLDKLLKSKYNFTTFSCQIPSIDPDDYLTQEILRFRTGKGPGDLLLVYYGGHAAGSDTACTFIANKKPTSARLNWLGVQFLLLEHSADVLLILDCCFATHAARGSSKGDNWFLGASAKESPTTGVAYNSFTSAIVRELDRRAELYKIKGESFTVQSIHNALVLEERDLAFTPMCIRLTRHECVPTDLTPMRKPNARRLYHSTTMPSDLWSQSSGSPMPHQSRPNSEVLPMPHQPRPSNPVPYQTWPSSEGFPMPHRPPPTNDSMPRRRPVGNVFVSRSPADVSRSDSFSIRLSGVPSSSDVNAMKRWLLDRLGPETRISRIGPVITSRPTKTVVTFSSLTTARKALEIHDCWFDQAMIKVDNDFLGLSCLYSPSAANPTIDLVFVHGTHGHAITTFASHLTNPTREASWPCVELPKFLEEAGIFPRIMTFGWAANVWLDPQQDHQKLNQASEMLAQELRRERCGSSNRPLVFIGHGVGGLLIKQYVRDIISFAVADEFPENPIKACFFFAVPNHPTAQADGFASVLAAMASVVRYDNSPDCISSRSLLSQNQAITALSNEFHGIPKQYGITIQCFHETQTTGNRYIVPPESASLDGTAGDSHAVDAGFEDMVKLDTSEQNLREVLQIMRDTIQAQLRPKPAPKPNPAKEKILPRLKIYDTVFLVDDSDSMLGPRWTTTSKVLSEIANIAVKYDKDGVDVRFFNEREEGKNLDSSEKVMELFKKVTPDGPTPTADVLEDELGQYLEKYKQKRTRKRLNLIVLTDGEPDEIEEVEEVIVKYANQLKDLGAHSLQVGVQFVQIGGDEAASEFLRGLDDDLVTKRGLDRDVRTYEMMHITR